MVLFIFRRLMESIVYFLEKSNCMIDIYLIYMLSDSFVEQDQ